MTNEKVCELNERLKEAMNLRGKRAVDLVEDLGIPKSSLSQYMNGISNKMPSKRLNEICKYLDVSEPWLLGYDVPMERPTKQKNDTIEDAVLRMRTDLDFFNVVFMVMELPKEKLVAIRNLLVSFSDDTQD